MQVFSPLPEQFLSNRHVIPTSTPQPMSRAAGTVTTPCVQVCIVDGPSGLCLGCYRSLSEIGSWSQMGEEAREAVMAELLGRRGRIEASKLAGDLGW